MQVSIYHTLIAIDKHLCRHYVTSSNECKCVQTYMCILHYRALGSPVTWWFLSEIFSSYLPPAIHVQLDLRGK